jgi:hypothetical protein
LLAVVAALTLGTASAALAGAGVGGVFNLGVTNSVDAITTLVGDVAGPGLRIDNNSTNAAATALDLQVEPGKAPMKVNSGTKVTNLNADKVDGIDGTTLLPKNQVRADGNQTSAAIDDFTSSSTPVISKSFTAPTSGFLTITGSISAEEDCSLPGSGWLGYQLRLDSTDVTSGTYELDYEDCANFGTDTFADSGAASAVVPVSAGSHTVHLVASEFGTGSFITTRSITAIFVPNGSGTVIPAAAAAAAAAEVQELNRPQGK